MNDVERALKLLDRTRKLLEEVESEVSRMTEEADRQRERLAQWEARIDKLLPTEADEVPAEAAGVVRVRPDAEGADTGNGSLYTVPRPKGPVVLSDDGGKP